MSKFIHRLKQINR